MHCRKYAVTSLGVENGKIKVKQFFLPCNSWSCPTCAKRKARNIARITKRGFKNEEIRFATLTMRDTKNITQAAKDIKEAWNRLRLILTRRYGSIKYVWTIEGHKRSGMPHLHVLLNKYIPQRLLSRLAERSGFGKIADIRRVKSNDAFDYVTKYLGKGLGSTNLERIMKENRLRRWSKSRSIKSETRKQSDFIPVRISDIISPLDFYAGLYNRNQERNREKGKEIEYSFDSFILSQDSPHADETVKECIRLFKCGGISFEELMFFMGGSLPYVSPPEEGWEPWNPLFTTCA